MLEDERKIRDRRTARQKGCHQSITNRGPQKLRGWACGVVGTSGVPGKWSNLQGSDGTSQVLSRPWLGRLAMTNKFTLWLKRCNGL